MDGMARVLPGAPPPPHTIACPGTGYGYFVFRFRLLVTAHCGHHVPCLMLDGVAGHLWRQTPHCHRKALWDRTYRFDRHEPPRSRAMACMSSIVSRFRLAVFSRAQRRHQEPLRTVVGLVAHLCPSEHTNCSATPLPMYAFERHSPPRALAIAWSSARASSSL